MRTVTILFAEPYTPSATRPPATPGECAGEILSHYADHNNAYNNAHPCPGIDCNLIPSRGTGSGSLVWVVGPVVAGIAMATVVVLVIVFRRRAQPLKQPMDGGQVADLKQVYLKAS